MKQATKRLLLISLSSLLVITGCKGKKKNTTEFTYNTYLSTKPKTWNVLRR